MYIAKGKLDSAFPQFHISLNSGSLFLNSRCGHKMTVMPATRPSFRRPSIIASSLTTGWNLDNLHWVDQSAFKLV